MDVVVLAEREHPLVQAVCRLVERSATRVRVEAPPAPDVSVAGSVDLVLVDLLGDSGACAEWLRGPGARPGAHPGQLLALVDEAHLSAAHGLGVDDFLLAGESLAVWETRLQLAMRRVDRWRRHAAAEQALETSNANLHALIENVPDYVLFSDRTGAPVFYNTAYANAIQEILGLELRPGLKPHESLDDPAARAVWDRYHARVLSGERFVGEYSHPRPDGRHRHFEISYNPVVREGEIIGFSEFTRDVTAQKAADDALRHANDRLEQTVRERTAELERIHRAHQDEIRTRRKAEEALAASEALYRSVYDAAPLAFVMWDLEGRVVAWNRHAEHVFGWSQDEVMGRRIEEFLLPQDAREEAMQVATTVLGGAPATRSVHQNLTRSGGRITCRWITATRTDAAGNVIGALSLATDISREREMEERARRSEKLEAIGQLAGGVAHDFNNQLVGVMGHAGLLLEIPDMPAVARDSAAAILGAAHRASDLVANLLAFARRRPFAAVVVDIHAVIDEVVALLEHSIDKRVRIERRRLADDACFVSGDATQIQSALLNLGLNARDAMPGGGVLTFQTSVVPGTATGDRRLGLPAGDYVEVLVRDTGRGMDEATRQRLFEPFYTTKPGGTGMGLAAVYGTVQSHTGAIGVTSAPGAGSSFRILLPRVTSDVQSAMPAESGDGGQSDLTGVRILVVDDEPVVRDVMSAALERLGCHVMLSESGEEAIRIFEDPSVAVDLVIMDVTMPGLTGVETLHRLRQVRRDVRAVLTSGYAFDHPRARLLSQGFRGFLAKPFDLSALQDVVRSALEG